MYPMLRVLFYNKNGIEVDSCLLSHEVTFSTVLAGVSALLCHKSEKVYSSRYATAYYFYMCLIAVCVHVFFHLYEFVGVRKNIETASDHKYNLKLNTESHRLYLLNIFL